LIAFGRWPNVPWRESVINVVKVVSGDPELLEIVGASSAAAGLAG
jgi:hypothetical protein